MKSLALRRESCDSKGGVTGAPRYIRIVGLARMVDGSGRTHRGVPDAARRQSRPARAPASIMGWPYLIRLAVLLPSDSDSTRVAVRFEALSVDE